MLFTLSGKPICGAPRLSDVCQVLQWLSDWRWPFSSFQGRSISRKQFLAASPGFLSKQIGTLKLPLLRCEYMLYLSDWREQGSVWHVILVSHFPCLKTLYLVSSRRSVYVKAGVQVSGPWYCEGFYYRVILTLSTSVYAGSGGACMQVHEWVCVCVRARARVFYCYWTLIRLCLKSRILYYGMLFIDVCVCWTFILPILVLDIGLYFTSEHYSYLWHVCVCVHACVRARSCRCEYVRLGVVLLVQMAC